MALILALALGLRLYGIGFGLPALNDPDELMFELGAIRMISHHTLNPGWFGHPATTTMYVLAVINGAVLGFGRLMGWFPSIKAFAEAVYLDPGWIILPGRWAMAVFGVGTVWATQRLATRLFDRQIGLLAALLLAVNPVAVMWSQVVRSDIMASFFMLLAIDQALKVARGAGWRDLAWGAAWLALAIASKWPFGIAGLAMAAAIVMAARRSAADGRTPGALRNGAVRLAGFCLLSLACLLIISPYLLLAHDTVLRNLRGEAQWHHLGATGGTPLWNAWWYVRMPLLRATGWVAGLFAIAGVAMMARRREAGWLLLPPMAGFAIATCIQHLIWERWALAWMPMLAMAAALAMAGLARRIGQRDPRLLLAGMALLAAGPLVVADGVQARERLNDTRQRASRWAMAHLAPNAHVLIEHFAFDLLPQPWHLLFPLGQAGCIDARAILKGRVDYATIESDRAGQANVDYGTMAPARAGDCRPDVAILTQYDRYKAERNEFPTEYQAYVRLLSQGRIVASFTPEPGESGGPVVRIVQFAQRR
ncbi:MAG: glycosyltransferase family 39 protein [Sphingomonadales bacterium]|nr:glycosyltransferase family 39 protein [Sphingomonadales bacterium]